MSRGCFWLTRGSNPRMWPSDPPLSNIQRPAGGYLLSCRRPAGPKMIQNLPLPARQPLSPQYFQRMYVIIASRKIIPSSIFSRTRHGVLLREFPSDEAASIIKVYWRPSTSAKASQATHSCCIQGATIKHRRQVNGSVRTHVRRIRTHWILGKKIL